MFILSTMKDGDRRIKQKLFSTVQAQIRSLTQSIGYDPLFAELFIEIKLDNEPVFYTEIKLDEKLDVVQSPETKPEKLFELTDLI